MSEMITGNKGIIFDMDGVIINTCALHEKSWFTISEIHHFPWNSKLNFRDDVFGTCSEDSAKILFGDAVLGHDMDRLCKEKEEIYRDILRDHIRDIVVPGFYPFFESIVKKHVPVVLATSSPAEEAELVLKSLGIYESFKAVIDISKVKNPKPHPEVYLLAKSSLGAPIQSCIGFEDSMSGITALNRAGVPCAVVGTTLSKERLDASGLDYKVYLENYTDITLDRILDLTEK